MYQICTKFEKSEIPMTKIFSVLTKVKIILSCFKKELPGERKTWQWKIDIDLRNEKILVFGIWGFVEPIVFYPLVDLSICGT